MNSKEFIIKELNSIFDLFGNIEIRYEIKDISLTHVVEITPIELFKSKQYIDLEIELEKKFSELFTEEIMFITSNSLTEISDPIQTWKK
jgi:hypothetical protein